MKISNKDKKFKYLSLIFSKNQLIQFMNHTDLVPAAFKCYCRISCSANNNLNFGLFLTQSYCMTFIFSFWRLAAQFLITFIILKRVATILTREHRSSSFLFLPFFFFWLCVLYVYHIGMPVCDQNFCHESWQMSFRLMLKEFFYIWIIHACNISPTMFGFLRQ